MAMRVMKPAISQARPGNIFSPGRGIIWSSKRRLRLGLTETGDPKLGLAARLLSITKNYWANLPGPLGL